MVVFDVKHDAKIMTRLSTSKNFQLFVANGMSEYLEICWILGNINKTKNNPNHKIESRPHFFSIIYQLNFVQKSASVNQFIYFL